MKIVNIGATGRIGSNVVTHLREQGHEAVPASPDSGVNTLTGEGLAEVLALSRVAASVPANGIVEIAGPQQFRFDEFIRLGLRTSQDPRVVVAEPHARYYGAELGERTLVPGARARLGEIRFEDWLAQSAVHAAPA